MSVIKNSPVFTAGIKEADYYEVPEELHVFSWSPEPPGTLSALAKPTQVHLHFGKPPGNVFVVRFKSARSLDALIAALTEHREYVWGKRS